MAFHGFSAEGVDLLQLNRLQNSKEFYDAHKDEIKRLSIRPFHELIAEMTPEMVKTMAPGAILFPMANPTPEIMPDLAKEAGAAVVGTGRSDFPNQINNVSAFPGIFRGALDVRASDINDEMKIAAAEALAGLVSEEELNAEYCSFNIIICIYK